MTTPSAEELARLSQPSLRASDRYSELYAQYMDMQRMLAMIIDQHGENGHLSVYDDPTFPRLAYICAVRGGAGRTDLSIVKVPE